MKTNYDVFAPMNNSNNSHVGRFRRPALSALVPLVLYAGLAPMSAHAFLDERTPAMPVETVLPVPAAAAALSAHADAGMVTGDLTHPAWQMPYPGPFGQMPLSDVLIAHVVPTIGRAIELNGASALLDRRVNAIKGLSRLETLQHIARENQIKILVQGPIVTLSENNALGKTDTAILPIERTWHIPAGHLLSTAILEWAKEWNWNLIWQADVDYRISAPIVLTGDFLQTVGQVLDAYKSSNRPLWGDWNREQKILIVREPTNRER